jgi:hypothetical protein
MIVFRVGKSSSMKAVIVVLKDILWGIVAVAIITWTVYSEYKRKTRKRDIPYRPKTEEEKETERNIAIDKERSRRATIGAWWRR